MIRCKNCRIFFREDDRQQHTYKHYNYKGGSEKLKYVFCPKCTYHVYLSEPKTL